MTELLDFLPDPDSSTGERIAFLSELGPFIRRLIAAGKGREVLDALGLYAVWIQSMRCRDEEEPPLRSSGTESSGISERISLPAIDPRDAEAVRATLQVVDVWQDYLQGIGRVLRRNLSAEETDFAMPAHLRLYMGGNDFVRRLEAVQHAREGRGSRLLPLREERHPS